MNSDKKFILNIILLLVPIYVGRIQEMIPFLDNLHIAKVTMIISLVILAMTIKSYSEQNRVLNNIPQIKYIIAIFVMALLSVPFGVWPSGSLDYIISNYIKLLLFMYLLIWCINTEDELNKVCWSFVLTVLLVNVVGFVNPSEVKGRVFVGSTYDPNDTALLLVIALPLLFYMFENHSGFKKIFLALTMIMSLIMILKTGSRGGLVGLVAVLCIISYQKGLNYSIKRLPVILILLFVVLSFTPAAQIDRLSSIVNIDEDYNATDRGGRMETWKRGLSIMIENPLLGCGINQFPIANGKMSDGTWQNAHNAFIQIGAELGIIGLVLFVTLIRKSIKSVQENDCTIERFWLVRGIRTGLYGFCVGGFFLSWAYTYGTYLLIVLSIIVQKIILNKESANAGSIEK